MVLKCGDFECDRSNNGWIPIILFSLKWRKEGSTSLKRWKGSPTVLTSICSHRRSSIRLGPIMRTRPLGRRKQWTGLGRPQAASPQLGSRMDSPDNWRSATTTWNLPRVALLSGTSFTALSDLIRNPNKKISNSSQSRDLGRPLTAEEKRVWGNNMNSELSVVKSVLGDSDGCGNIKPGLLLKPEKVSPLSDHKSQQ